MDQERLAGRVALVAWAPREQGTSHAVRLAEEGADIIAFDVSTESDSPEAGPTRSQALTELTDRVEARGRRLIAAEVDLTDGEAVARAVDEAVARLGRLDVVAVSGAIPDAGAAGQIGWSWDDAIDLDVTGTWNVTRAAIPHMISGRRGGSIAVRSTTAGAVAFPSAGPHMVAQHAAIGLARSLALELAPHMIRVNAILATSTKAPATSDAESDEALIEVSRKVHALPVPGVEPVDISNAIAFLASDEARYITGIELPVDAGFIAKSGSLEQIEALWSGAVPSEFAPRPAAGATPTDGDVATPGVAS